MRNCLYWFLFLSGIIYSQNRKVIDAIESNKFMLDDSSVVRLAGIDVPSLNHENFLLASYAHQTMKFSEINLLNQTVQVEPADDFAGKGNHRYVSIFVGGEDYAITLLSMGLVKVDSVEFSKTEKYREIEALARENKVGIWSFDESLYRLSVRFDKTYVEKPKKKIRKASYDRSVLRIASEVVFSPVLGGFATIAGYGLINKIFKLDKGERITGTEAITVAGLYAIATSTAVYLIAEEGNENVKYLPTLLYGTVGTAAGIILSYATESSTVILTTVIVSFFAPIIAPVLYANLVADSPDINSREESKTSSSEMKNHSDYYNSTQIFSMDLLRVPLR